MKSYLVIFILVFVTSACNTPKKENTVQKENTKQVISYEDEGDRDRFVSVHWEGAYFEFDEVTHYSSKISNSVEMLYGEKNLTKTDSLYLDAYLNARPNSLEDTSFISNLTSIEYEKYQVEKKDLYKLRDIFRTKGGDMDVAACIAVYRDILIFKKQNEIIGIANMCFTCNNFKFRGTNVITNQFGTNQDIEVLRTLLKENKK